MKTNIIYFTLISVLTIFVSLCSCSSDTEESLDNVLSISSIDDALISSISQGTSSVAINIAVAYYEMDENGEWLENTPDGVSVKHRLYVVDGISYYPLGEETALLPSNLFYQIDMLWEEYNKLKKQNYVVLASRDFTIDIGNQKITDGQVDLNITYNRDNKIIAEKLISSEANIDEGYPCMKLCKEYTFSYLTDNEKGNLLLYKDSTEGRRTMVSTLRSYFGDIFDSEKYDFYNKSILINLAALERDMSEEDRNWDDDRDKYITYKHMGE